MGCSLVCILIGKNVEYRVASAVVVLVGEMIERKEWELARDREQDTARLLEKPYIFINAIGMFLFFYFFLVFLL